MADHSKNKKRPLPQWMVAVKEQEERKKVTKSPGTDEKFPTSTHDETQSSAQVNCTKKILSASEIVSGNMPWLRYEGPITYSYSESDCACICQDILSQLGRDSLLPRVVGFDSEWSVSFSKGSSPKTAVIQMCFSEKECYLFQVSCMLSLPKPLQKLILDKRVVLVGVNIEADLWKLERDYDFRVKPALDQGSVVDLAKLANEKLKSCERWSLDGLCQNVLKRRLDKDRDLRCGNWDNYPLSKDQQLYACNDAFAGLELYKHLSTTEK
ncbi:Werner syndrome [Elysia marginata]|uniref:3'-5' exonuclease n=1 Tax=Elysia marginata TaxID=1093978 RepID=A0AAV4G3C8_9GAST|nr:Werner syndrome [Elysia marginata]